MEYVLFSVLPAFAGGIIQGVTGFGAGIIMMIFLPLLLPVNQAAGVSVAIGTVLCATMAWRYRAKVRVGEIVAPALLYLAVSSACILFAAGVDQNAMKGVLGVFLVMLAVYFLFFQSAASFEPKWISAVACIAVSGVCDGLFGVGGPLMVLYYLARIKDRAAYLGTIQGFFLVTSLYSTAFRLMNGIIGVAQLGTVALGAVGVLAGLATASAVSRRLDPAAVRKLTYAVIGVSGVSNLVAAVL